MICELGCDDLKDVGFEELIRKMVVLTEDGCYALRVIDEGAGGGGSYTFPTNHGNTAYVSVDGNDGTGVVGNISKPFENIGDAILALDNAIDGVIIILSSSSAQVVNDYDYTTMPYNLSIFDFANTGLSFGGSCSFGTLKVRTGGIFLVATDFIYTSEDNCDIQCDVFEVSSSAIGDITFLGILEANTFTIPSNTNNPSLTFGTIIWKVSLDVNEPITYTKCNPRVYRAILSQSGTSNPTATVLENTAGISPSFTYVTTGINRAANGSPIFTANKTIARLNPNKATSIGVSSSTILSTTQIDLITYDEFAGLADGNINGAELSIEIYP